MKNSLLRQWRTNFFAGLAVVLPAIISIAVMVWLFGTVSNVTDFLLVFIPKHITHKGGNPEAPIHWYWSLCALAVAITLITATGRLTRHFIGQRLIELADSILLRIPLLNKIYGAIKQVNDAFSSGSSSFKQVVLVEFPQPGQYTIAFVTAEQQRPNLQVVPGEKLVTVYVPTTPNPTNGFLLLLPEKSLRKLDMSVADGIKHIVSFGAIAPELKKPFGENQK